MATTKRSASPVTNEVQGKRSRIRLTEFELLIKEGKTSSHVSNGSCSSASSGTAVRSTASAADDRSTTNTSNPFSSSRNGNKRVPKKLVVAQSTHSTFVVSFPERLMELLNINIAPESMWWLEDGTGFCMNPNTFSDKVLNKYVQGTKWESFTRKLNRWGFKRAAGQHVPQHVFAYYHSLFLREQPDLVQKMTGGTKKERTYVPLTTTSPVTCKSSKDYNHKTATETGDTQESRQQDVIDVHAAVVSPLAAPTTTTRMSKDVANNPAFAEYHFTVSGKGKRKIGGSKVAAGKKGGPTTAASALWVAKSMVPAAPTATTTSTTTNNKEQQQLFRNTIQQQQQQNVQFQMLLHARQQQQESSSLGILRFFQERDQQQQQQESQLQQQQQQQRLLQQSQQLFHQQHFPTTQLFLTRALLQHEQQQQQQQLHHYQQQNCIAELLHRKMLASITGGGGGGGVEQMFPSSRILSSFNVRPF